MFIYKQVCPKIGYSKEWGKHGETMCHHFLSIIGLQTVEVCLLVGARRVILTFKKEDVSVQHPFVNPDFIFNLR